MKNGNKEIINMYKEMVFIIERMTALQANIFDMLADGLSENKETETVKSEVKKIHKKSTIQNWRLRPTALEIKNYLTERNSSASGNEILEMMQAKHSHEWDDVKKALSGIKLSVEKNPIFEKTWEAGSFEESLFGIKSNIEDEDRAHTPSSTNIGE